MSFFSEDYLDFFRELKANNQTAWFHASKKRYQKSVKEPFTAFVREFILQASRIEPSLTDTEPKKAIFRINRDIRFSKDKTPYKTHMAALFSAVRVPGYRGGFYFQFGADGSFTAAGAYKLDREHLYRIRRHIASNGPRLESLVSDNRLHNEFGELQGEKNKVLPAEFKEPARNLPVLFNKQFYFQAEMPPTIVVEENLLEQILALFITAKPFNDFLREALESRR